MTAEQSIIALVPMRHASERVPEKNFRLLAGKPLYAYILETLHTCSEISQIVVDTDSPVIVRGISEMFPEVVLIDRPDHLRAGEVPMNDVLLHDVALCEADIYLQTHSTNPLLRAETISAAIAAFRQGLPEHDSLFSVTKMQTRLWNVDGSPLNHDPSVLLRTQDLPPVYEENSCIYIFQRSIFIERENRLGFNPRMFEVDSDEAWDIDEGLDFLIVDRLMQERIRTQLEKST
jgi:CMP-N-acetylneuraminic acid synthetase